MPITPVDSTTTSSERRPRAAAASNGRAGLSFLQRFMDVYTIAPYRRLGCTIPEGLSSGRVLHGRPYLNVTMFYYLVVQLYENPAFLTEHGRPSDLYPAVLLGPLALLRAGFIMMREWRKVATQAPHNFFAMKQLAELYQPDRIQHLSVQELTETLNRLGQWLDDPEGDLVIVKPLAQAVECLGQILH